LSDREKYTSVLARMEMDIVMERRRMRNAGIQKKNVPNNNIFDKGLEKYFFFGKKVIRC